MSGLAIVLPVQWGEMDAFGHVNNARFFTWFESARIALFERIGVPTRTPMTIGPILATTSCDYLAPVKFPATIEVRAKVSRVGDSSMTIEYEVEDVDRRGTIYARGSSVAVLIDYRSMQKVRVPDDVREAIAALGAP